MSNIPEEIFINIEETANFLKQNGRHFLEQLKTINKNNPNFSFLFPESPYHSVFLQRVDAKLQGSPAGYSYAPPSAMQTETDQKKSSSRWGAPIINDSHYNFSPQQGQQNMQHQQHNYPQSFQSGNPVNYNNPHMPPHSGSSYPNYYNNPQQGQFFNNSGYNQQSSGGMPQQSNLSNMNFSNAQPLAGFPNYSHGNVSNPPAQGVPQVNPMMFGNNQTTGLPSYMNQFSSQQGRSSNERKSSVDKKEMSMSMETESPKSKIPRQYNTPEDVPVGVMADMLKQQAKRYKERNATLRPYTPLDPEQTPQVIPSVSKVSESVKTKLELFYKFLNDEREIESLVKKKKGNFDMDLLKSKAGGDKKKEFVDNKKPAIPEYQNIINSEMGVRADGQTIGNVPGSGEERKGLGSSYEDVYSSFRKQRSHQYHVSAEERAVNRDAPELCYVCRMPGHLARDCKFGLT